MLRPLANNRDPTSHAARIRRKRFTLFESLISRVPKPLRILDVGGTQKFWEVMGFAEAERIEITILNPSVRSRCRCRTSPPWQVMRETYSSPMGALTSFPRIQSSNMSVATMISAEWPGNPAGRGTVFPSDAQQVFPSRAALPVSLFPVPASACQSMCCCSTSG
jgi:hypothetical protein